MPASVLEGASAAARGRRRGGPRGRFVAGAAEAQRGVPAVPRAALPEQAARRRAARRLLRRVPRRAAAEHFRSPEGPRAAGIVVAVVDLFDFDGLFTPTCPRSSGRPTRCSSSPTRSTSSCPRRRPPRCSGAPRRAAGRHSRRRRAPLLAGAASGWSGCSRASSG